MSPRLLAQVIAAGRVAIGAALVAAPDLVTQRWVGPDEAPRPGTRILAGGLGVRDVGIGAGTLAGIASGTAQPWLIASAAGDLVDLVSAVRYGRGTVPGSALAGTVLLAGGSAAVGAWLLTQDV